MTAAPGRPRAGAIATSDHARTLAAGPTCWPTAARARIRSTGRAGREAARAGAPGSTGTAGFGRCVDRARGGSSSVHGSVKAGGLAAASIENAGPCRGITSNFDVGVGNFRSGVGNMRLHATISPTFLRQRREKE